jgi:leader peptidase (prepilin peptidase) / N-methyltransferase
MGESSFPLILLVFILGVTFGSFLNVVIYRARSGASLSGRSKCLSCAKPLKARHLFPLFSYLLQWGRCAYCGVRISLQYPLVEAVLGVLYVAIFLAHGGDVFVMSVQDFLLLFLDLALWTVLLAIAVYDIRHKIIPDPFALFFAILAGVSLVCRYAWGRFPETYFPFSHSGIVPDTLNFLAAPILFIPFACLWAISRGRAMGLGDAKLAWGMGWMLGFAGGVSAVVLAFWIALLPSLTLLALPKHRFTMKSEIPFAPFLILGTLAVYLFGINILNWTI